ncbi:hypothetical protein L7E55_13130 [Pelotomaculum isophthalicicum JI]|uniref:Uncharacterized protein n=1 Tax=Pelotomaculum isophthalicicum JI TaxID=947010 RepID=A0A9X4H301_9FIRM|nr:hypothetical protein [Pelotomaculum isophthalicicum]MDF9409285.1 hypothetical protein [Pelotomaculum isophthalicicum JI]
MGEQGDVLLGEQGGEQGDVLFASLSRGKQKERPPASLKRKALRLKISEF